MSKELLDLIAKQATPQCGAAMSGRPRRSREDGFALPFTIFLVTIVTILLAAAFTRATSEHLIAEGSEASISALAVAQSGLQSFFADSFAARPAVGDSFRYNVSDGYAWVFPELIVTPADSLDDYVYIVHSDGYVIHANQGATPMAQRTVAQFAKWQTGHMDVDGALVIPNGIISRPGGAALTISGNNPGFCPGPIMPNVASIRAPIPDSIGGVIVDTISATMTWTVQNGWPQPVALGTDVKWSQIVGGDFVPDYTSIQPGNLNYRTQMVIGNATLSNNQGTGLLIVTGNLTFSGAFAQWDGVILVGGRVLFNAGSNFVFGTVISGLTEQYGVSPPPSEIGGAANAYVRYASCRVNQALAALTGFVPIENARVDNWATY